MSRATRRYYRTLFLSIAAMGALVWVAVDEFELSRDEVLELFLGAVLVVGTIIVTAAAVTALWLLARRLLRRYRD